MLISQEIKKNYDLTYFNTFRLSGRADFFVTVKDESRLKAAARWARSEKLPIFILGGGSNIILAGRVIKGLVIKISGSDYQIEKDGLISWCGTALTKLAFAAEQRGLSGLEWACGIPGSLGGAIRGNAGAYGSSISDAVAEVEAYDSAKNKIVKFSKAACGFSYRNSIFKEKSKLIIVRAKLKLSRGKSAEIKKIGREYFDARLKKNPREPSAGCIFKNLEFDRLFKVNQALAQDFKAKRLVKAGKIASAHLIDWSGFKGKSRGDAKVSHKHANFIINSGLARPAEVIGLIKLIKRKVKKRYHIILEEEIEYFGLE